MLRSPALLHVCLLAAGLLLSSSPSALGQVLPVSDSEVQEQHEHELCAKTPAEMAVLYEQNLEDDLLHWKLLNKRRGHLLNSTHLKAMLNANFESRGRDYISTPNNALLIKDGKVYYPFRPFAEVPDCSNSKAYWCDARIAGTISALEKWMKVMPFPDAVFYVGNGDAGACGAPHMCPVPQFTFFKQRYQPDFKSLSYAPHIGFETILMPNEWDIQVPHYTVPWEKKVDKAFFRGTWYCTTWHLNRHTDCPRIWYTNMTHLLGHGDKVDCLVGGYKEHFLASAPEYSPVPLKENAKYKYVLSLDGVSASTRFSKLLRMNSVVLKTESPWISYYQRSVKAYEHYIPILVRDPLDVLEVLEKYKDKQGELQRIAGNAQRFSGKFFCPSARMLYLHKSIQEYKALFSDMQAFIDEELWPMVQFKIKMGLQDGWQHSDDP